MTEEGLAAKLARVSERLDADAPNMERSGADLIAFYLSPGRHPADQPWSRKHADTQAKLCARFLAPVIATLACQDIRAAHMQAAVNAAPLPARAPAWPGPSPPWSTPTSPAGT